MPLDISKLTEGASGLADSARQYTQSDDFTKILPYLLSGGGGALVGSLMTGKRRKDKEGRLGYLGRILSNAAMTGGLAAGGHYLLNKGIEKTVGETAGEDGLPGANPSPGDPLSSTVKNIAFSPLTAGATGATALAATSGNKHIGAGRPDSYLKSFSEHIGKGHGSTESLRNKTPEGIGDIIRGLRPEKLKEGERLRRLAGLASDSGEGLADGNKAVRGALSKGLREYGGTFGQTWKRRTGRGALGLAAAGIPALIGAIATKGNDPAA